MKFSFKGRQASPLGDGSTGKWSEYAATDDRGLSSGAQTYDVWVDPVQNYTIDLPTSDDGRIANPDEYESKATPEIDLTSSDHFITARLVGDFSGSYAVMPSTVDGGVPDQGYGNKLDLSGYVPAHTVTEHSQDGVSYTFGGALLDGNALAGTGITFTNFQILYAPGSRPDSGQSAGDLITGSSDIKNIYLGNGNNLVSNVSGGVLPGQSGSESHWQTIHLGSGTSTVEGSSRRGRPSTSTRVTRTTRSRSRPTWSSTASTRRIASIWATSS